MRGKWITVFCTGLILFVVNYSAAQDAKEVTFTGRVVDDAGEPVVGAKVGLYKIKIDVGVMSYDVELMQQLSTEDDGKFVFRTQADGDELTSQTIILVRKEGLAFGWANWQLNDNSDAGIILNKAQVLAGTVVDEARKPVADAEISISFMVVRTQERPQYLIGQTLPDVLTVKTNKDGKFSFENIPAGATAEFVIKKTGKATVSTLDIQNSRGEQLQFAAGQTDIEIILPDEAKIEGTVVDKATGKPVPDVKMIIMKGLNPQPFGQRTFISKEDGTFSVDSLAAGVHKIQIVSSAEGLDDWVAEPMEVITEPGKTKSGVKVELIRGGILEVEVTEADSNKPIENARIIIQQPDGSVSTGTTSDVNGIAGIRLNPGQYQIVQVYKEGYSRDRRQEAVTVENGKTARVKFQLGGQPKITGVVRDQSGNPITGARIRVCPMGRGESVSGAEGKFEVIWDPGSRPSDEEPEIYIVARHEEKNLAAAVEIENDTKTRDIQLLPGITLIGKAMDPNNKGIPGAQISIMLRASRSGWGSTIGNNIVKIDEEGNFEVKAVPIGHRYSIHARADGYGQNSIEVNTKNAVNNRLDAGALTLPIANLSISGIVVDSDGKPVAGARIYYYGENQQSRNAETGADGKFTLDKLCEGSVQVSAEKSGQTRLYGSVQTEGGASGIKIIISERQTGISYQPKQPASLVRKALPELKDLNIEPLPAIDNKAVLICFFDMQQRPSRNCLIQLSKKAQELKEKDITVIAIQATKIDKSDLDEWIKEYDIPYAIGMVETDWQKARFAWGVSSLPWLILTDKNHIVSSNGFPLSQLDNKIRESGNVQ
ncbi:MAG: carboxypeptidase regulatory-like domain-containing protein [Sedimentisphaerales bacterium]|nr:carboxypeptidase regulatory-like domain-containing protein [Sedimentisphaerales bacterium]